MARSFPPPPTPEDRRSKRHDGRESSAHDRRREILNRSRFIARAVAECMRVSLFFSSRGVCAKGSVSLQERVSHALFSPHARHLMPPMPQVTGVLSDQFVS